MTLYILEGQLDIKHINMEMHKLLELDYERNKQAVNLIIFGLREEVEENTLVVVKIELHNMLQIETTFLTKAAEVRELN